MRVLSVTGVQTCAIPIYDTARVILVVLKLLLFPAAAAVTVAVCELEYDRGTICPESVHASKAYAVSCLDKLPFTSLFALIVTLWKPCMPAVGGLTLTDAV